MSTLRPVRAIVVGAGIGGLSAAIALRSAGLDVVVVERAPRLDPLGAGISLFRNALRGLERLGVREAVLERGAPARRGMIQTADGRILARLPEGLIRGAVALHRAGLQSALLERASGVRLDAEVISVAQNADRVTARLRDGTEESGDLLVGADGIHSVVRRSVMPGTVRYAGYTAWRSVAPFSMDPGLWTESWGCGERFGLLDLGAGRTYWFATRNAPEGEPDEPGSRRADVARRFSDWHPPIGSIVEATPPDTILRNDVYHLEPLPQWSRGRVVLLGDAAHASTPGIGQGAAQAIEDAVALGAALEKGGETAAALAQYEARRRPRAQLALRLSRRADRFGQLEGALVCRLRDMLVRAVPMSSQARIMRPLLDDHA
jgi:2-polyprenyl-6-methoxyphenol hydroxylase-like FAD-dependent oxidoreductase